MRIHPIYFLKKRVRKLDNCILFSIFATYTPTINNLFKLIWREG